VDVDVQERVLGNRLEEFGNVLRGQVAKALACKVDFEGQIRTTADIDCDQHEGFVHRSVVAGVADDVFAIGQGMSDRLTEQNPYILYRMMIVHVQVSLCTDAKIDVPMKGHQLKHVIEKPYARSDIPATAAIEIEDYLNPSFGRLSLQLGVSDPGGAFAHQ
jgi:hypothetical protein